MNNIQKLRDKKKKGKKKNNNANYKRLIHLTISTSLYTRKF